MEAKKRWQIGCWVLAGVVALSPGGANAGERGGEVSKPKEPRPDASGEPRFHYEKVTDRAGKAYWLVRMTNATYRIPAEYVRNIGRTTVVMDMHWPTRAGPYSGVPQVKVQTIDLVTIMLEPPRIPPIRDSYEVLGPSRAGYHAEPSAQYPGLLQTYYQGKPGPDFVSGPEGPRTPSGNPYLFSAPMKKDDPNAPAGDTRIALPEGTSVRVDFRAKHLADWHRIYPAVLRLIDSFRRG